MARGSDIHFISDGETCRGWFYPTGKKSRGPCVVLAHGFGGTKELRLDAYAERFAAEGYRAMVFDYRHFGGSDGAPRQILDIAKQHRDWEAAIAHARSLPGVDPGRIVLWGTSFSGGHVAAMAARDGAIAGVISQVPHLNGPATALAAGLVRNLRLGLASSRDLLRRLRGREPYYVPIVGEPGSLAAMSAPGDLEGVMKLVPPGHVYDDRVAARIFLSIAGYSPGNLAPGITVPWLVQVALRDLTTPVEPARKAAKRAPRGEFIAYDCGHFDVYVPPAFELTVSDQINFLRRHVRV
ncbi:MAG: alpha/beta hydrolase [Spirochaetes bacterium]|nr:alpha/beta hydrolase [Spirochaetota bacterium]